MRIDKYASIQDELESIIFQKNMHYTYTFIEFDNKLADPTDVFPFNNICQSIHPIYL